MFAAEIEWCASLPGVPTCTYGTHVILHPLSRFRPRHAETPCNVTLDLSSQTQDEASPAHRLQVPGEVRSGYRTPGERQCDTRNELKRRWFLCRERHY